MKLIVGLGNPGPKYKETRHNLGWQVVDQLGQNIDASDWENRAKLKSQVVQAVSNGQKIILAKPQTFMNESGSAVKLIIEYYKIPLEAILIVHDDLDFPLGEIKIQKDRNAGGHHGVESIIDNLKTKDFARMRIGIGPTKAVAENNEPATKEAERFVLEEFNSEEKPVIQKAIKKAADIIAAEFLDLHNPARETESKL